LDDRVLLNSTRFWRSGQKMLIPVAFNLHSSRNSFQSLIEPAQLKPENYFSLNLMEKKLPNFPPYYYSLEKIF
jgi:hypothetical protein